MQVLSVNVNAQHGLLKLPCEQIHLLKGLGVGGDAHCGAFVQHGYTKIKYPNLVNLRQVHLISAERIAQLHHKGFNIEPGVLGENITTQGLDLESLPLHTVLYIGLEVQLTVQGTRRPCTQVEEFQRGLSRAVWSQHADGTDAWLIGIMCTVTQAGVIRVGDTVSIPQWPPEPHVRLPELK
jgi:MOSC domain-containing protein YiiM